MARTAPAPLTRLVRIVLCFSIIVQPLLFESAPARAGSDAGKVTTPASKVAARQEAEAADLPDLNEARNRPHREPRAIRPVPSTRRRCPPRNRRCNDNLDGPPRPAATPRQTPPGRDDNPRSLASVTTQSLLAVLSAAMNGGRPAFDIPLLDYLSEGGGYSVSDSAPPSGALTPLYAGAAAPLAQAQPNTAVFVAQSVPTVMQVGQQYNVAVTMRNTGTNTWTSAANYKLGSQSPQDNVNWGMSRVTLPSSVAPGTEATITFTVTAPTAPGTYNFQWRMVQDGVAWFGDYTSNVSVSVASAAMVGRWKFDDGSGIAVTDSSGNGNTGTLRNGTAWVAGAVGTGALDFDGVNDSVSVNTSASIDSAVNNFTLSFWVNPRAAHQIDAESTSGLGGTSGEKYAWGPRFEPGSDAGAGVSVGTNGVSVYEHAVNYMPATLVYQGSITGWTHVTVVYQNRQPRLYVNGAPVRTGLTSPRANVKVRPLDIGGMVYGYYNGQMDDVRLYNGALTAAEIASLANTPGRLVANWKFDEGSGTTASDATGNGSAGTLQNGPTWVSGKVGAGALSFDGVNDDIAVSSGASLTSVSNDFAITFWANPRSAHEIDPEGTSGLGGTSGQRYVLGPSFYGGMAEVGAGVSVGTNGVSVYEHAVDYMPATLVYQGTLSGWTHVAVVYENRQPRLYLNGALVRVGNTSPASTVRVAPWNLGGNSYGYFDGQLDDVRVFKGAITAADVQVLYGGQGTGLTGEYYDNVDFTGYAMTRTDPTVSFDWAGGAPSTSMGNEQFSVRWTGTVVPRYSETYTFYTTTDDGVRLWIDGQLIIDKWVDQGPTEWTGQMTLEAGRAYAVRMEFYENYGGAQAKLSWSSASQVKEIIPQTQLNGCWKDAGQFARDFYQAALARQPYAAELTEWTENLSQAQGDAGLVASAQTLGANVFNSPEYVARNRSDIEYVTDLYWAYLQRAPDASGLNFWSGPIIACGSDQQCRAAKRADARISFAQSDEFREKVRVLCGTSAAATANGGVGYDFSTARLDPNNRTGGGGTDPYSRNFNFSIPLLSLPGRAGLDLGLALSYNSLVWTKDSTAVTYDADGGFPSPGFRLGFPVIEPKFVNPQIQQAGQPTKSSYLLVTPSGGRVELRQTATPGVYESADSSYLQLTESGGAPGVLRSTDGMQLSFTLANGSYRCYQVKDKNGNYISVAYYPDGSIDRVTDTLGRVITFEYDPYQNLIKIKQPWKRETEVNPSGVDESHEWATFGYENLTLQPQFSNLAVIGDQPGMTIPVLSQVGLDDGSYYKFYYNQWGQVWKATHFAADAVDAQLQPTYSHALSYTRLDLPGSDLAGATPQTDCPRFTQEKTWVENGLMNQSGEVTTLYSPWSPNMASCEVTMPDLTTKQVSIYATAADGWKKGLTTSTEVRSSGQLAKTTTMSWEHDGAANAPYPPTNPRVTQTTVSDPQGNGRTTRVTYTVPADFQGESGYTGTLNISLPKKVEECDAGCANVLRTTVTDYKVANLTEYVARRILRLVKTRYLYEGVASAASLRSQVGYVYDEPNDAQDTFLAALATPASQHDGASYGQGFKWRGNVNRERRYSVDQQTGAVGAAVESRVAYSTAGTVAYTKDAAGHKISFGYEDSFFQNVNRTSPDPQSQLKTYAYPTAVTDADGFTANTSYNYDMGVVGQVKTPLPNITTYQPGPVAKSYYDTAARPVKQLVVDSGAYTSWVYPKKMDMVERYSLIETGKESFSTQVLDGLGRVRATATKLPFSNGEYSGQLFDYDSMGRLARQSNPTATSASGSWPATDEDATNGWLYTQTSYDWKGRPLTITNPGSPATTKEFVYGGCGCAGGEVVTTRDEVGRRIRVTRDVLGRVWKTQVLTQQPDKPQPFTDGPTESVYLTTTNTYDALDHVRQVVRQVGTSGATQVTTNGYDGYGRMSSHKSPEATAATSYAYYDDDMLRLETDARGATATYEYNGRHKKSAINFYTPSSVEPTSNVELGYDGAGNRLWMTDGLGRVDYEYNGVSQLTAERRYFNSLARTYRMVYDYNKAGQLSKVVDAFDANFYYQRDAAGRLTDVTGSPFGNVTSYVSNVRYRAWGGVKSASYGDNTSSTTEYDTRLRPSKFRLTDDATGAGRMREDFGYYADSRLATLTDLNDTAGSNPPSTMRYLSRTYSYDLLGRVTEVWGTGGAGVNIPLSQFYGYDEFDNLTSRSGSYYNYNGGLSGTQTDTAAFTNNRRAGWAYDADGRYVSNPASTANTARNTYYDAAGRQVRTAEVRPPACVGCSSTTFTATQAYDGDGRVAYETTLDSTGTGTFKSSYTLRSTALGGEPLTTLNSSGGKSGTNVPAQGLVFSGQSNLGGTVGEFVSFTHRDPVGVTESNKGIYDPLGNFIPFQQPSDPRPPAGSYNSGSMSGLSGGMSNPNSYGNGCVLDNMPADCTRALLMLNHGAAEPLGGRGTSLGGRFIVEHGRGEFRDSYYYFGNLGPGGQSSTTANTQRPRAVSDDNKVKECIKNLFGVTLTELSIRIAPGIKQAYFKGTYKSAFYAFFGLDIDNHIRVDSNFSKTAEELGGKLGVTYTDNPYVNYVAGDRAADPARADEAVIATIIHELGNSLAAIMDRPQVAKNPSWFPSQDGKGDRDSGAALEECVYGGYVETDGTVSTEPSVDNFLRQLLDMTDN